MAIQIEVTLQPDYVLSACEREKSQCIAEIVILYPDGQVFDDYPCCVDFLSAMWRHYTPCILNLIQALASRSL